MNQVAKQRKKLLKLEDFNPWGQLLSLWFLFVSCVLVEIMFHHHSFHNKAIMITFGSQFGPQTQEPSGQKQQKLLTFEHSNPWGQLWELRSLFVFFVLVEIMFHSHFFHANETINSNFRSPFDPQTHEPSGHKTRKNH